MQGSHCLWNMVCGNMNIIQPDGPDRADATIASWVQRIVLVTNILNLSIVNGN